MRDEADEESVVVEDPPDSFGFGPAPGVRLPPLPVPEPPILLDVDDCS